VDHGKIRKENGQGYADGHMRYSGIVVKLCHGRTCGRKNEGKQYPHAYIDPKKVAGKPVIHVLALNHRFCIAIQPKAHQQQAKSRDHGDHAKIGWSEESSENNSGYDLDRKYHTLGENCNARTTHCSAPQFSAQFGGQEFSSMIKWLQSFTGFPKIQLVVLLVPLRTLRWRESMLGGGSGMESHGVGGTGIDLGWNPC
ncbi:MAG TPA: hypothetical protein VNX46_14270, partial [Candidatus Acidoferrum sp.]|nr:hypothetical protein [Candidatus Acidoferrum sp.]